MRIDLLVVGASFAGLACARAAALAGLRVVVLEKKLAAGDKLHTTGIIVKDAIDSVRWLRDVPPAFVRRIEGVRLYAPNLQHMDLHAPGYYFLATDTSRLLDWMVEEIRSCGAKVRLGSAFETAAATNRGWQVTLANGEVLDIAYIVGADGPKSRVAKALDLSRNTQFLFGVEHEYIDAGLDADLLHCFIDKQLAPGYIGWALAGVGVSQVGLARRLPSAAHDGTRQLRLDSFLAKTSEIIRPLGAPLSVRAGMIPCGGVLARIARPRALMVGDASGMVSPVTAGGIHTALRYGEHAGVAVARYIKGRADDPAAWLPRTYPRFGAKRLLRWGFDRFQSDWIFNAMLATAPMRRAAELVYFHRKGGVPGPRR